MPQGVGRQTYGCNISLRQPLLLPDLLDEPPQVQTNLDICRDRGVDTFSNQQGSLQVCSG